MHAFALKPPGGAADSPQCMRRFAPLAFLLSACSSPVPPAPPPDTPARTATPGISEVLLRLGDEDCAVRRVAAEELLAAGHEALPVLEEAKKSADPEVSSRARELAAQIRQEPLVWVGTHDDRWENADNWSPAIVPDEHATAIVAEAVEPLRAPVIRGNVVVKDLVLLRGSELSVEEGAALKVAGRFRSRGTLRASGTVEGAE